MAVDHNEALYRRLGAMLGPRVTLLLSTGLPGLSQTRNVAVGASTGEAVAFLDDDAVAERDWLANLAAAFADPRVVAVGGEAVPVWPGGSPPLWFPVEFDFVIGCTGHKALIMEADGTIRSVTGSNMAFRREVFQVAGLWETSLGRCEGGRKKFNPAGGEEAEMCLRIRKHLPDGRIVFRREAVVHHKVAAGRAKPAYMLDFCLREGHTRALMKGLVSRYGSRPLAAEGVFVRRLLWRSIGGRLVRCYRPASLPQAAAIVANLSLMVTGYLFGRWIYGR